jgi:hypothetical protein
MITDILSGVDAYNNLSMGGKIRVPYRGKSKVKIIKGIEAETMTIGDTQSLLLCVEEYKEGYDDVYLEKKGVGLRVNLQNNDQIGSQKNYALLYPIIEEKENGPSNKWLVVIYDTPNKDDLDIVHTIKNTLFRAFDFKFKDVLPVSLDGVRSFPKIEVTYTTLEQCDEDSLTLRNYLIKSKRTSVEKIEYENVPVEQADNLINDTGTLQNPSTVRKIKLYWDQFNKSLSKTYTQRIDDFGNISSLIMVKYGYDAVVPEDEMGRLTDMDYMRDKFTTVINNYLNESH